MADLTYPRTYRLTYLPHRWRNPMLDMAKAVHEGTEPPEIEPLVKAFECHAHRTDGHFVHFAVIKRFDQVRNVPVWLNIFSIPWERVVMVELIRDDSEHAVPLNAADLEELLHPSTAAGE